MLSTNQLKSLKKSLEEDKQAIKIHINVNSNMDSSIRETVGELSAYDNHPADLGTELFERERDFAIEGHQDKELKKINTALKAIDKGTYGKCQVCGDEIPFERLEVLPSTLHCVNHSPETSSGEYSPVKEHILVRSEVNSFMHEPEHGIVDTQDSFREVARFGTSETPADLVGDYNNYSELYNRGRNEDSLPEDYETYSATDITGEEKNVLPSRKLEEYEELLDSKGIESKIGDIPYKKRDSYIDDQQDDKKTETP
ncbi:molecular chaperone DnaK [Bacillus sp. AFS076308]|uniref:TraR/DksA C4-type zinc finger protein n=1 Tax=unclassified Bacillus (in: firmicutes) TaxID=185979 RepID=UPI000BF41499|nr:MULTISPECIES: TraR/DksA C4-type zinc finger protein [unclassified Bacillus (in: firmicutes)]PFO07391.1 molecular chaperone DnaK [Bacillus sp. AFS076308]PGV52018.1 molecular chaperone DnaK [Bacillus sp. AFS037270]